MAVILVPYKVGHESKKCNRNSQVAISKLIEP